MAFVKNYGLEGIASDVQLGKAGPRLKVTDGDVEVRAADGSALTNLKAAEAVDDNDVVVKSQLDDLASQIATTDGFGINLGDIVASGDGSWTPGAVSLNNTTKVSEAVDRLNEVLGLLIPSAPPEFPNGTLAVSNTAGSNPRLASGSVPNASGSSLPSAGTAVTRITASGVTSNTFSDVGPGNEGTVSLLVDGSTVGSKALTGSGDTGTFSGLVIADQKDFPVSTPGFWKSIDVSVSSAAVTVGYHKVSLSHSAAGDTNEVFFVRDDLTAAPSITGGSVAQNATGTLAHSSSVPHYGTGASLTVGLSVSNLSGETYYGGSDPLVISGTNGIISSDTLDYAALGIATPIARQTTGAVAITPVTVSVDGANVFASGQIRAVAKNVNGASSATTLTSTNVLVMSGTASGKVYEMSVPVTGLGSLPNASNAVRVGVGTGDTPTSAASAWASSAALPTHEAAVVAGVLAHDQTDYSTGYLPVGPDLSVGRDGAQYATFSFNRSAVSTFKINVTGSYAGCWVKLPGVSDNTGVSPNAIDGWWDAFKPYDGAGVPGETGDSLAGCALGTVMNGAGGAFVITFGTQTSSNSTGNTILVRFKLTAGQSITALAFSN